MNPGEFWLLQQFNAGNRKAFELVYNRYFIAVYHHVQNMLRNDASSITVTAAVFEQLWRIQKQFSTMPNLKAYLLLAARNTSLQFLDSMEAEIPKQTKHRQVASLPAGNQFNQEVERVVVGMVLQERERRSSAAGTLSA